MRLKFILSEVGAGLRRNLTMTIAMILTPAILLGLLGTGLLIKREIDAIKEIYYAKVQVSIFLTDDVTDDDKQAIEQKTQVLTERSGKLAERLYAQSQQEAGAGQAQEAGGQAADDVVDAEFEEVKNDDRKS